MAVDLDDKIVTGKSIRRFKEYVDAKLEQVAPLTAEDLQTGKVPSIKAETFEGNLIGSASGNVTPSEFADELQKKPNPNLLDNPWFTVNQRNASSSASGNGYGVDRWMEYGGHYTINGSVISLPQGVSMLQRIEDAFALSLSGKTITTSVMLTDGTIITSTNVFPQSGVNGKVYEDDRLSLFLENSSGTTSQLCSITAKQNLSIKCVKVELGDKSTLAYDAPPNYATELLKCQRYFQYYYRLATSLMSNWSYDGVKYKVNFNFPKMRVAPQISFAESSAGMECPNRIFVPTANFTLTEVTETSASANVDAAYAYTGSPYYLYKVSFSADL